MRNIILVILFVSFLYCSSKIKGNKIDKEKACQSKVIDAVYLKKYLVITDSCKVFDGNNFVKYFDNNRLVMSGYSKRNFREGKWSFFDQNEKEVIKGSFVNSQPIGIWNFNKIGTITWDVYTDLKKGYRFSFPKEWELIFDDKNNTVGLINTGNIKAYDLLITYTSGKLSQLSTDISSSYEDLNSFYEDLISSLKKRKASKNLKYKKLNLQGSNEAYEVQYDFNNGNDIFVYDEILINFKDRVYFITTNINKKANYDYSIIKEIMMTSFKVYNDTSKK